MALLVFIAVLTVGLPFTIAYQCKDKNKRHSAQSQMPLIIILVCDISA